MTLGVEATILIVVVGLVAASFCHVNDLEREPLDEPEKLSPRSSRPQR